MCDIAPGALVLHVIFRSAFLANSRIRFDNIIVPGRFLFALSNVCDNRISESIDINGGGNFVKDIFAEFAIKEKVANWVWNQIPGQHDIDPVEFGYGFYSNFSMSRLDDHQTPL